MKKNSFDNRLQNDLFPDMPASFERGLKKAMEQAGVKPRKRATATGIFTGVVSVATVAACLVIVIIGIMGRSKSKTNAASPSLNNQTVQTAQPTESPTNWNGITKVIALSSGFDFANEEKYSALYKGILAFLRDKGESEPDELWLCGIKNRTVKEDTGKREDGYLSGYYVLAQHAFGEGDGPELYCLSEDYEVLWCTEGSVSGPNHAVNPERDSYVATYQNHFIYGTVPTDAHVTRGALAGTDPKEKTDVEFSMCNSITKVRERLAGSAHMDAAREYFLITVSAHDWDSILKKSILRFETAEGNVDINLKTELPKAMVALGDRFTFSPVPTEDPNLTPTAAPDDEPTDPMPTTDPNQVKGVEYWLSQNQLPITDLTAEWDDKEAVEIYGRAIVRALQVSGEHISAGGIWVLGVTHDVESMGKAWPWNAYVLALNVGDGEPSPELFYFENGRILWMTQGASTGRINVVYHNGNTIAFGKSPAFDNSPLAMTSGKLTLENGDDELIPILPLEKIRERVTDGPYYYSARECYLWKDATEHQINKLTINAEVDGKNKTFTLDKVNVLTPQTVPAMAVRSDSVVYPGKVIHLAHARDENGLAADGSPLMDTLQGTTFEEIKIVRMRDRALPWEIITISDNVTVERVEVYSESLERLHTYAELSVIDTLPPGKYYLCFHTTTLGPYSETIGRYAYRTDFTIYKVTLN